MLLLILFHHCACTAPKKRDPLQRERSIRTLFAMAIERRWICCMKRVSHVYNMYSINSNWWCKTNSSWLVSPFFFVFLFWFILNRVEDSYIFLTLSPVYLFHRVYHKCNTRIVMESLFLLTICTLHTAHVYIYIALNWKAETIIELVRFSWTWNWLMV